tara:strand:- start:2329 stop:2775 length:447 start_codon:yes stop_codon:yes gene_type:complete
MLSAEIPWFKNSTLVEQPNILEESWNYQFTHVFYRSYSPTSELLSHIDPLLIKINPAAIIRVKANMIPRTHEIHEHQWHVDIEDVKGSTTAIFYINSNNGASLFKTGERVESVENRLVVFPSETLHTGTSCNNQQVRCVINLNYFQRN